jgi:hypothetical protein
MNPIKGTFTAEPVVKIQLEGFEPLPELRKKSEWHGMWELRAASGSVLIIQPEEQGGFLQLFAGWTGRAAASEPVGFTVVKASPSLLVPINTEAA